MGLRGGFFGHIVPRWLRRICCIRMSILHDEGERGARNTILTNFFTLLDIVGRSGNTKRTLVSSTFQI